ncbi:MAG: heme-binding protein [Pseudomonadota bacterium]
MRPAVGVGIAIVGVVALAGAAYAWTTRGIETPAYTVARVDGSFELRQYPSMVMASIDRNGSRGEAVRAAFSPLAGYIFARNRDGEKIAMTAPVTQEPADQGWTVSFIMPAEHSRADLPDPGGDVRLVTVAPRRIASVTFSGRWTDARFQEQAARLLDWMAKEGLTAAGPPEFAYYNDPFTPFFLRRNEVLVPVAAPG